MIVTWITDDVRASLMYKRETDEEFKERSAQNIKNKTEGPKLKRMGTVRGQSWL